MPDQRAIRIPAATQSQYPELVSLILGSESMNEEERQYWLNILPAMTPAQRQSLQDILIRERQQLQAIDRRYKASVSGGSSSNEERHKRQEELSQAEARSENSEESTAGKILEEIDII